MNDPTSKGHWAEIGAFFAGALIGGALIGELTKVDATTPLPPAPGHPAAPVSAEVIAWGDISREDLPERGMRGMILAFDGDVDMSRALGSGIMLRPEPMETRQR